MLSFERKFTRYIDGGGVPIILKTEDLKIGPDLDRAAGTVASLLGLVAELTADVSAELGRHDAEYRHWRAGLIDRILKENPKTAEWKAKAQVEATDMFLDFKAALADLEADLEYLRGYSLALRTKSYMISAKRNNTAPQC